MLLAYALILAQFDSSKVELQHYEPDPRFRLSWWEKEKKDRRRDAG